MFVQRFGHTRGMPARNRTDIFRQVLWFGISVVTTGLGVLFGSGLVVVGGVVIAGACLWYWWPKLGWRERPRATGGARRSVYAYLSSVRSLRVDRERVARMQNLLRASAREGHERFVAQDHHSIPEDFVWLEYVDRLIRRGFTEELNQEYLKVKEDSRREESNALMLWTGVASWLEALGERLSTEPELLRPEFGIPEDLRDLSWED